MKKISLILALVIGGAFFITVAAQCPMCRMTVESNLQNQSGMSIGRTINAGIMYMLAMPYLLVGTIGYIWYKNRKKAEELEAAEDAKVRMN